MPRFYCPTALVSALASGEVLELPAGAARHVQVLRMQPAQTLTLFDGSGGEFAAVIHSMGRSSVAVQVLSHNPIEREAARAVHLALGVPANDRMDWLVEKATELGVASIQPLMTQRGVLRLSGERATKKVNHWQAIAIAAAEQCGRNRLTQIHPVSNLQDWLQSEACGAQHAMQEAPTRVLLGFSPTAGLLSQATTGAGLRPLTSKPVIVLSGAEGGLSPAEEKLAMTAGFVCFSLGACTLRAETAALVAATLLLAG